MQFDNTTRPAHSSEAAKEEYWRAHLAAQERSGLTLAEYCRRNRLSKSTFGWWKNRLRNRRSAALTLVPVSIIPHRTTSPFTCEQAASGVALVTRDGCRIEIGVGFHPATLEQVLRTLGRF